MKAREGFEEFGQAGEGVDVTGGGGGALGRAGGGAVQKVPLDKGLKLVGEGILRFPNTYGPMVVQKQSLGAWQGNQSIKRHYSLGHSYCIGRY